MTKKLRYLLIAIGFVFFIIAAPLIVLYVRGISYDFKTNSFVKTGILGVRSVPQNVQIFLNGKLKRQSQGDIKFLLPDEYEVTLKKPGYYNWNKRLTVNAGLVTWANTSFGSIYMFLQNPPVADIADGVLDFYSQNGNYIYLDSSSLTIASVNDPRSKKTFLLPKNVDTILTQDQNGNNFVLTDSESATSTKTLLLFNKNSASFYDLSAMFPALPQIQFGLNGEVYALSNNILYSVNAQAQSKTVLFSGVKAFFEQNGSLYFIQTNGQTSSLLISQQPFLTSQILITALPEFRSAFLFVTFEKEILLVGDGHLYLAGSGMQDLADNISSFSFNPDDSFFSFVHSGEFDYYDPVNASLNFVTRSSEPLADPRALAGIGNAFYIQGDKLMAIELDARDSQNQYQLYQSADLKKFFVDDEGKNILLLDGSELKSITIR